MAGFRRKRRSHRVSPYKKRKMSSYVNKLDKTVNNLRKAVETKHLDYIVGYGGGTTQTIQYVNWMAPYSTPFVNNALIPDKGSSFYCLNYVPLGDDDGCRTGEQIRATSLDLSFMIDQVDMNFPSPFYVRCILFVDKAMNGTLGVSEDYLPTPNEVLDCGPSGDLDWAAGYPQTQAPINWKNRRRFHIIKERTYHMSSVYLPVEDPTTRVGPYVVPPNFEIRKKWHIKLNRIINFKPGTDDQISMCSNGSIFFMVLCSSYDVTADDAHTVRCSIFSRLKYQDA